MRTNAELKQNFDLSLNAIVAKIVFLSGKFSNIRRRAITCIYMTTENAEFSAKKRDFT